MTSPEPGARRRWRPSLAVYLVGLLAVVVSVVTGEVVLQRTENLDQARTTTRARAEFQASLAAQDITDALTLTESSVAGLAANPGLTELFATEEIPTGCTLTFTGAGPFVDGHIDIVDRAGAVRCSSTELPEGPVHAGARWLDIASGDPVITQVVDPTTGSEALVVAAPIPGLGAVATFLELDAVEKRLAEALAGPLGVEFELLDASEDERSADPDDITGVAAIEPLGSSIRASIGDAAATARARDLNRDLLVFLLIGLATLAAATYLIYRSIGRPIERLSAALHEAAHGGGLTIPTVRGPAEVAFLSEQFAALDAGVRAELARRQASEASYRTLFDAKPQPTWVHDRSTGVLLEANLAMERRYGMPRAELLTMRVEDLLVDEGSEHLLSLFEADAPIERSGPWLLTSPDGEPIECLITSTVIDLRGKPGRLVIAEDVTKHLRTERLLNRAQRMESLGHLAGGIAHDFNNLLAVMLNYAEFVGEEIERAAAEDPQRWTPVLRDIGQIGEAGGRAAELTQQLLSFARGKPVQSGPADLNEVVSEVVQMLQRTLGGQVELDVDLDPALPSVTADDGRLQQVVLNLAVNARDAMPDGGRLLIETAAIDVTDDDAESRPGLDPGPHVRLRVSDTGTGMDAETRDRALEPFFTTKQGGTGGGLGLATVYGIVTEVGGTIQIYSEPDVGTSITILFPVAGAPAPAAEAVTVSGDRPPAAATVLVTDDDERIREIVDRVLTREGYVVLLAPDGPAAIETAAGHPDGIDLLLTDIVMPDMLGSELASHLRSTHPSMRVLFMSGYSPPLLVQGGMLPVDAPIVDKPFSTPDLVGQVRAALDR